MKDGRIVVNNDMTNEGRYLLPRTARGLYEMYVARIQVFGEPDMARLVAVVSDELAKIDAGRIKVSLGLREELRQVQDAVTRYLDE